jgi:hypothetical protein
VPRAPLHAVEGHLQHHLRPDHQHRPVTGDGGGLEGPGEFADLPVGQAGIGLAHVHQPFAVPDGKGDVGEHRRPPPVAPLRGGDHHVQGGEGPLHLAPGSAPAPGLVAAAPGLEHQALVAAGPGRGEEALEIRLAPGGASGGEAEPGAGVLQEVLEELPAPLQGLVEEELPVPEEEVEGHQGHRHPGTHFGRDPLSGQALLEDAEGKRTAVSEGEQFAVEGGAPGEAAEVVLEFGEGGGDVLEAPGEERDPAVLDVGLHPDAIELVLDQVALLRHEEVSCGRAARRCGA